MDMDLDEKEKALLDKVSAAFEPYLRPSRELSSVRRSLRSYIAAQLDDGTLQNPLRGLDLDGLGLEGPRAEYVKAVRANRTAKNRFAVVLATGTNNPEQVATHVTSNAEESDTESDPAGSSSSSRSLLTQHVELLRLQRQHTTLVTLKDELDALRRATRLTTPADTQLRIGDAPSVLPETARDLAELADSLVDSVKALERAVIEAHHHSIHERTLLEDVKARSQDRTGPTLLQRLAALSATRRELTVWLEESLEKCQGNPDIPDHEEYRESETGAGELDQDIDDQYERYIEARKRLLAVVGALRAPPPEQARTTSGDKAAQTTQNFARAEWSAEAEVPRVLEKVLLPTVQQQSASQGYLTFVREQQEDELLTTINMLDRLSDESQILQAFPLLARSGRFEHAASTFGKTRATVDEAEDEVIKRMQPWLFAAEAAEVATSSTVEAQLTQGNQSMDRVAQNLSEWRLLHELSVDQRFQP